MRRAVAVLLPALCLALVAGCSASTKADVGPTRLPTGTASTPTPTPTPTPTAPAPAPTSANEAKDLSDAKLGIVFVDAPHLTGDAADVYNSLATYEREYWRTMTTNKVSGAVSLLGSGNVRTALEKIATTNAKNHAQIGGTLQSRISAVDVSKNGATATVCDTFDRATFKDPDGTYTPKQAGFGDPRRKQVTLIQGPADGVWIVQKISTEGTC